MTDFRELCAELLDQLDFQTSHHELKDLKARARGALAEPEPVNPWKEALIDALVVDFILNEENSNDPKRAIHDLINWNMELAREPLLAEGDGVEPEFEWRDIGDGRPVRVQKCPHCGVAPASVDDCGCFGDPACPYFGIGTSHPRPIPVYERLPTAADCDAEGRVWWLHPKSEASAPFWYLAGREYVAAMAPFTPVAWLPAAAIPLPEVEP